MKYIVLVSRSIIISTALMFVALVELIITPLMPWENFYVLPAMHLIVGLALYTLVFLFPVLACIIYLQFKGKPEDRIFDISPKKWLKDMRDLWNPEE